MTKILKSKGFIATLCVVLAIAAVVGLLAAFGSFGRSSSSGGSGVIGSGGSMGDVGGSGSTGGNSSGNNIGKYGYRSCDYASLYVQDGLVGNYLGYSVTLMEVGESFYVNEDENAYVLKNLAPDAREGTDLLLRCGQSVGWHLDDGGIGYSMNYDKWESDKVGIECPISLHYDDMPSFDIEALLRFDTIRDVNGEFEMGTAGSFYHSRFSTFRFDLFCSRTLFYSSILNKPEGYPQNYWWLSNSIPDLEDLDDDSSDGALYLGEEELAENLTSKVALLSVTRCAIEDFYEPDTSSYPYVFVNSYVSYSRWNNKAWNVEHQFGVDDELKGLYSYENDDLAPRFSLLNNYPGTFYALRVYDRQLSDSDKENNFFVDLLAFYKIGVSQLLNLDANTRRQILAKASKQAALNKIEMTVTDDITPDPVVGQEVKNIYYAAYNAVIGG